MRVLNTKRHKDLKVLIGTPIHSVKDYSMKRWLQNVNELIKQTPADLLLVDNSLGTKYIETVTKYCQKYGIKNYKIVHIELPPEQEIFERVARSREIIRKEIISKDYAAWFSWECDQLIPADALDKLVRIMKAGNFMVVEPNSWAREVAGLPNTDGGVALFRRDLLEKYSFILTGGWELGETGFRKRAVEEGGSYVDVYGVIDPIYHLNQ